MIDLAKSILCICVPNYRGVIEAPHHSSMLQLFHQLGQRGRNVHYVNQTHTIVDYARQVSIETALTIPDCSHVLFIDDDMTFTPEQFFALENEFLENDLDFLSALAFTNAMPTKPCIFGRVHDKKQWSDDDWWHVMTEYPGYERPVLDPKTEQVKVVKPYGEHRRFRVAASGFGMVLLSRRMLEGMRLDENGDPKPRYSHFHSPDIRYPHEDVAFCVNAIKAGYKLWCDSRITIGHISKDRPIIDEQVYIRQGDSTVYMGGMERKRFVDDECDVCIPAEEPKVEAAR